MSKVAYLGIGFIGLPMAVRLAKAGHELWVWNRSREKCAPALAAGARLASDPADAAANADVIMLCLTDANAVDAVVFGERGIASVPGTGKLLVDHSSMRPDATREYAARLLDANGMKWMDAPVSGGVTGAEAGTLAVMCGGDADDFERAQPLIAAYAGNINRMGPVGAGQTTKLCNQLIVGSALCVIAEAVTLAKNSGVDASMLAKALAGGWGDSKPLQVFVPRMTGPEQPSIGASRTMLKDLDTALDLARETDTPLLVATAALEVYRLMNAKGLGDADPAKLVEIYSRKAP